MKFRLGKKKDKPALKRLFHCLTPQRCLEVTGRGHLPSQGPVVLVAGREEGLDLDVIEDVVSHPVHLVRTKNANGYNKGAVGYSAARPLLIGARNLTGWRKALKQLRKGESLVISPMGCTHRDRLAGAVGLLARRSGAPIVPLWCSTEGDALHNTGLVVTFGPPAGPIKASSRKSLAQRLEVWFRALDSTAANHWPSPKAPPRR